MVNVLKTSELYTSKGLSLWYVSYISVKKKKWSDFWEFLKIVHIEFLRKIFQEVTAFFSFFFPSFFLFFFNKTKPKEFLTPHLLDPEPGARLSHQALPAAGCARSTRAQRVPEPRSGEPASTYLWEGLGGTLNPAWGLWALK